MCSSLQVQLFLCLVASSSAASSICDASDAFLRGGKPASEGQFKFNILSFYSPTKDIRAAELCSGALVAASWVLLAAHCFKGVSAPSKEDVIMAGGGANIAEYLSWRLGTSWTTAAEGIGTMQERRAVKIVLHPEYSPGDRTGDLAIIQVLPFDLGLSVNIIRMGFSKMQRTNCTVLGWGVGQDKPSSILSPILMYADYVPAAPVSQQLCTYKKNGNFICLLSEDVGVCKGDSGGPLVCDGLSWGVQSQRVTFGQDSGRTEVLYTELWPHITWIQDQMTNMDSPGSAALVSTGAAFWLVLAHRFL